MFEVLTRFGRYEVVLIILSIIVPVSSRQCYKHNRVHETASLRMSLVVRKMNIL
jgi:hypothetical protein